MPNPFRHFISEATKLIDLVGPNNPIPDEKLFDFEICRRRLEFLRDLIARVKILAYCYDSLCCLTNRSNNLTERRLALPSKPDSFGIPIPQEMVDEEEQIYVEVDAFTSLIYYEAKSVVDMFRQLDVLIDRAPELKYLVKIRDRFLSHVRLSSVMRRPEHSLYIPQHGFLECDIVSHDLWTSDELRTLGKYALKTRLS